MATSRVPAALDVLLAALRAAPGLVGIRVCDGPEVLDGAAQAALWVGYDGDPEGDDASVTSSSKWAGLGARARDETFAITCAVAVMTGASSTTAVRSQRQRAYELFAVVEDIVRSDPSLGLPSPSRFAVTDGDLYQEPIEGGTRARLVFTVTAEKIRI
jgi:hypothetical protein